jgi:hypothetical protein
VLKGAINRYSKWTQNDARPTPPADAIESSNLRDLADQPPRAGGIT